MSLQLDTVFVWINELERSLDWYEKLGLAPGTLRGPFQNMEVEGPVAFGLHVGNRPPGPSTAVPSFASEDLDSEIARLADLGIEPTDDEITDTGRLRFITFQDPDGNEIQLLERR